MSHQVLSRVTGFATPLAPRPDHNTAADVQARPRVRFDPATPEPTPATKCRTCGHRNVAPDIRGMYECHRCHDVACAFCLCSANFCFDCAYSESFRAACTVSVATTNTQGGSIQNVGPAATVFPT
eukprot:GFYU01001215.1.p1 GENE.GFYU01001215.1~~GFYU01001215.1.p1  ORF type:complete len:125 (-),score=14.20 GFYU01001215.1:467-841(-)